jgi:hypothetical protein
MCQKMIQAIESKKNPSKMGDIMPKIRPLTLGLDGGSALKFK